MMQFTNYRKAQSGEIKCKDCVHSKQRKWSYANGENRKRKGLECSYGSGINYIVGANMTCDSAQRKTGQLKKSRVLKGGVL